MPSSRRLPAYLRSAFQEFLRVRGKVEYEATVALKIEWLLTRLDDGPLGSSGTFYDHARWLDEFGPRDDKDRRHQIDVIAAFSSEVRHARHFRPRAASRAISPRIMKQLLERYDLGCYSLGKLRIQTKLKLAWWSGVWMTELQAMRRNWLERRRRGYLLTIHDNRPWRNRTIPIPLARDKSMCAVRALDRWLELSPPDQNATLFPRGDGHRQFEPNSPFNAMTFRRNIRSELHELGHQGYTYTSIRVSYFTRCRAQFGEMSAFYLSGMHHFHGFQCLLRAEVDVTRFPLIDHEDLADI
jgi:hypothetical protein